MPALLAHWSLVNSTLEEAAIFHKVDLLTAARCPKCGKPLTIVQGYNAPTWHCGCHEPRYRFWHQCQVAEALLPW